MYPLLNTYTIYGGRKAEVELTGRANATPAALSRRAHINNSNQQVLLFSHFHYSQA